MLLMMMYWIGFLTITLLAGCREFDCGEKFSYDWRLCSRSRKFLLASCDVGWRLVMFSKFSRGCWKERRGRWRFYSYFSLYVGYWWVLQQVGGGGGGGRGR